MAYCRFNSTDSDVYVFASRSEGRKCWVCCGCHFNRVNIQEETCFFTPQGLITHLNKHVSVGDKVPQCAFIRLERDKENDMTEVQTGKQEAI